MTAARIKKINDLCIKNYPLIRAATLRSVGFCGKDTDELVQLGYLQRIRRGYYISSMKQDDIDTYEILSALIPDAVLSLFSAAQYHGLSTVIPQKIDITLPAQRRIPVLPENIHVKIYKAIPRIYEIGIQIINKEGHPKKVYDRERTICDFFRMRLQIGKDCAFEVLKNYMAGKKNLQKLSDYANEMQLKSVLYPYIEVLAV